MTMLDEILENNNVHYCTAAKHFDEAARMGRKWECRCTSCIVARANPQATAFLFADYPVDPFGLDANTIKIRPDAYVKQRPKVKHLKYNTAYDEAYSLAHGGDYMRDDDYIDAEFTFKAKEKKKPKVREIDYIP